MGLLPCLRHGSLRWWLPLSAEASDLLARIMLSQSRPGNTLRPASGGPVTASDGPASDGPGPTSGGPMPASADPVADDLELRAAARHQLRQDPPLLIYAALSQPHPEVTLNELADWWIHHATIHFSSGDAFLGAPELEPTQRRQFAKLRDHFRTLPLSRWLDDAALWLEVVGPPVPPGMQESSPRLIIDEEGLEQDAGRDRQQASRRGPLLQQLAHTVQRQRSLQQAFDDRVREAKLEAIKQFAYGLSHEINNPLANISTRAQQLQASEIDERRAASLQRIVEQVYRAHEMIADLMFYANPPEAHLLPCDLGALVRAVVEQFEPEATRQAIDLRVQSGGGPVQALVDESMIREAVGVLVRNAMEAIGHQGTIVVSVGRAGEASARIEVADSGPGLSDQAREHAFDPYFSGREAGRGLGLGLCRAYRIAKLHRAEIELTAAPAGCVATITIPNSE